MLIRNLGVCVLTIVTVVQTTGMVWAQGATRPPGRSSYSNRLRRPSVTPYLNLFRQDSLGQPSYYTLVRPQLAQQQINGRQELAVSELDSAVAEERRERQTLPATGHPVRYRYFSHFYNRER